MYYVRVKKGWVFFHLLHHFSDWFSPRRKIGKMEKKDLHIFSSRLMLLLLDIRELTWKIRIIDILNNYVQLVLFVHTFVLLHNQHHTSSSSVVVIIIHVFSFRSSLWESWVWVFLSPAKQLLAFYLLTTRVFVLFHIFFFIFYIHFCCFGCLV